MGGGSRLDIEENLIDLGGPWDCGCHDEAQAGMIKKDELFARVALRLNRTVEDIEETVYHLLRADKGTKR
jgi:hypothetical protein